MSTDTQNKKIELVETFLYIDDEARFKQKAQACDADLDLEFFEILTDFIQSAQAKGNEPLATSFWEVRNKLEQFSSQGKAAVAQINQERGMVIVKDQDDLLERLISAENTAQRKQLVAIGYDLIDDKFFRQISFKIGDAAKSVNREHEIKLTELRSEIYDLKAQQMRENRAAVEQAEDLFKRVLQANRPEKVLQNRAGQINEAFFFIVGTNIAKARNQGQEEIATALETVGKAAAGLLQARRQGANGPIA